VTIALLTIYVMLALLFRSWRVGITALVPNLVPVLFFFGFMGWGGIPLNITTSLVASVVLGLAVDNSVQFIVRFRQAQKSACPVRDAILLSLRLSGRPIIYANIALAATFAIFTISNFQPIGSFGLLSAVTILGCLVEDLILLPARLTSPSLERRTARVWWLKKSSISDRPKSKRNNGTDGTNGTHGRLLGLWARSKPPGTSGCSDVSL
jgi:predicted RND superfamily exporter protein